MYSDKEILKGDSGIVGSELFNGKEDELDRKISVIRRTISDKDFTLNEALEAYGVTEQEYTQYLIKSFISTFKDQTGYLSSTKTRLLFSIELISTLYTFIELIDNDSPIINSHFSKLIRDIEAEKIAS
jgi:hypothetical protein